MNIINTLLLYLSLLTATGLGAAPTPEITPEPTPAPTAVVEQQTPAPEATAPQATAAPEPTITPNLSYGYLRQGNKGDDVRRLQTRLRELGYLTGNVDGSFGRQTYSALLAFQHANHLTADGVAGPATLTALYENPKVIPNLARVTVSPEPTATPDAEGVIPLPENPTSIWVDQKAEAALLNGEAITAPHVWLRGSEILISLTELAEAVPAWTLESEGGNRAVLTASGHTVTVFVTDERLKQAELTYYDQYSADVDGKGLTARQGDVVFADGQWTVTDAWLAAALSASVQYDADENTLVIRVMEKD